MVFGSVSFTCISCASQKVSFSYLVPWFLVGGMHGPLQALPLWWCRPYVHAWVGHAVVVACPLLFRVCLPVPVCVSPSAAPA